MTGFFGTGKAAPGGAFEGALLHVEDRKAQGTQGGAATGGAYNTRDLNNVLTNEIAGASLSANQVTLPAGTYDFMAVAPAFRVDGHVLRLQDITGAATLVDGMSGLTRFDNFEFETHSFAWGRFTLAVTSAIELQHFTVTARIINGLGVNLNQATVGDEIYAHARFWKVG